MKKPSDKISAERGAMLPVHEENYYFSTATPYLPLGCYSLRIRNFFHPQSLESNPPNRNRFQRGFLRGAQQLDRFLGNTHLHLFGQSSLYLAALLFVFFLSYAVSFICWIVWICLVESSGLEGKWIVPVILTLDDTSMEISVAFASMYTIELLWWACHLLLLLMQGVQMEKQDVEAGPNMA
ncbi:hypothetical protein K402DRAFT_392288 [Aulographum hederae CBS 113979]|uniref:Uncharacterized protein n=1 Tax=Aulographum hederae CBS 113979 TaxID=1176131 RepID=A0A6G1H4M1_9PEZI|nr:hypothetical protein K402DRAFT_392288 [Aulographum hederae CBS 113979]